MKSVNLFILSAALALPVIAQGASKPEPAPRTRAPRVAVIPLKPVALKSEGKKYELPDGGWFTWKFDKKPQLGPAIIKVQVFSKDKKKDSSYEITGESGMPAMHEHDSGPIKFQLNKKGDYLLPVDVVMSGDWEVVIRIKRYDRELFAGRVSFNV